MIFFLQLEGGGDVGKGSTNLEDTFILCSKGPPMFGRSNVLVAPAPLSENVMELAPSTNGLSNTIL